MDHIYRSLIACCLLMLSVSAYADSYRIDVTSTCAGQVQSSIPSGQQIADCYKGEGKPADTTSELLGVCPSEATKVCYHVSWNGALQIYNGQLVTILPAPPPPPPPPCSAGNIVAQGLFNQSADPAVFPSSSRTTCYGGCIAQFYGSYPVARALVGGKYRYFGKGYYETTGSQCTAGAPQGKPGLSDVPPSSCGEGQVLGQFNGADMCLDGGTGEPTNPNEPTPPQTDTTTTTTTNNADGSTTTTQTTTRPDGSQTIIRTTTAPDGSKNSTTEERQAPDEDPKKSFCEENPEAGLCQKSDFAGGCGGFNCKGDAIQCAIAKEQHRRNCTLFDTTTALSDLGNQLASGADPEAVQHPALASNRQVFDLSSSINTSKQYAGSCPADRTITVMGQSIAIPLSTLCSYFEMFGNVMIALALLGAARTVGVF